MKSVLLIFVVLVSSLSFAQNYKVIHSFSGYPNDGMHPIGPVVFDKAGNMYGTTPGGGSNSCQGDNGCGVAYELSPNHDGSWTESILYNFCANYDGLSCLDGAFPSAGLAIDASGNLYGVTEFGGLGDESGNGGGVAFKLSPPKQKGGSWSELVLYNFCSRIGKQVCLDGGFGLPSQVVFDNSGNLYGTKAVGGTGHVQYGAGVVFELSPGTSGWSEKVLYNFCSQGTGNNCPDGFQPSGGVTFDKAGNLYGTTSYSGTFNIGGGDGGTLFELSRSGAQWKYQLLATVPQNAEPSIPAGPVSLDSVGNVYGTLGRIQGGVFKINSKSRKLTLFKFNGNDGGAPIGGVYLAPNAAKGYGATSGGGANGSGTIFGIDPSGREDVLYDFCSEANCIDGSEPWAMLVSDAKANLYGTTEFGGSSDEGVLFEIVP